MSLNPVPKVTGNVVVSYTVAMYDGNGTVLEEASIMDEIPGPPGALGPMDVDDPAPALQIAKVLEQKYYEEMFKAVVTRYVRRTGTQARKCEAPGCSKPVKVYASKLHSIRADHAAYNVVSRFAACCSPGPSKCFSALQKMLDKVAAAEDGVSTTQNYICDNCGHVDQDKRQLQRCSRCKGTFYCSRECQVAHWPKHKAACIAH